MTESQKLELRASQIRQKLNGFSGKETTEAEQAEIRKLSNEYNDVEARRAAAMVAEDEPEKREETEPTEDREAREIRELSGKVELRNYLQATALETKLQGAEAELTAALKLEGPGTVVPWAAFDPGEQRTEDRQDVATVAPAQHTTTQEAIVGRVFANTATAYLGIRMPSVGVGERTYPVLTAGTTAETLAKAAEVDAAAATFSVKSVEPRRLTARYLFSVEDLAIFAGMEEALRADLNGTMGDQLDLAILQGNGTSPNVAGVFDTDSGIAAPATTTAETSVTGYIDALTGMVDGVYASESSEVKLLVGPETYRHMAKQFISGTDTSALQHVRAIGGGVRVSAHTPDKTGKRQEMMGVVGSMNAGIAIAPTWPVVSMIRDPYTAAAKGQIAITVIMLYGFVIVRTDGFKRINAQIEA